LIEDRFGIGRLRFLASYSHPGVSHQVIDQLPHTDGPIHSETDEIVGIGVEFAFVSPGQQLDITRYHSQRFLKVMGGHLGELLQIFIRPGQFLGFFLKGLLHPFTLSDVLYHATDSLDAAFFIKDKSIFNQVRKGGPVFSSVNTLQFLARRLGASRFDRLGNSEIAQFRKAPLRRGQDPFRLEFPARDFDRWLIHSLNKIL
jgi:hypothetical protein